MHIRVDGRAAPQGSKTRGANGGMFESSKAVGPWREAVRAECQRERQRRHTSPVARGTPVRVIIQFYLARPAGHYRTQGGARTTLVRPAAPPWPAGTPDLDKLQRAVLDGLTAGGAWDDDSQVVMITACKGWAGDSHAPGCDIWISRITDER